MTDAQKAALEWLDGYAERLGSYRGHARTLKAMLAQPRLPAEPTPEMLKALMEGWWAENPYTVKALTQGYRALYAHVERLHVDFDALDEARMDDSSDAGASPFDHGRGSKASGGKAQKSFSEPHNCTPAARDELRAAISVLRGWSAEAAGRTGLAESVLIVCNAAEATLPRQMYRVRNGAALDVICPGPISISEVSHD